MLDYIVFFGMLAAGMVVFVRFKPPAVEVTEKSKCESPIERKLYNALTFNGYVVKTQVPCGRYRIDLALPGDRIAIEADGKAYHSSPSQKERDKRKDAYLRENGWKVLRFSGSQINRNIRGVLKRIDKEIKPLR